MTVAGPRGEPPLKPRAEDGNHPPPLKGPRRKKEKIRVRFREWLRRDPTGLAMVAGVLLLVTGFLYVETRYLHGPAPEGAESRVIMVARAPYFFRYDLIPPAKLTKGENYPLVVVMHDMRDPAYVAAGLLRTENKARFPAFILIPRASPRAAWATPDDPRFEKGGSLARKAWGQFPDALPAVLMMIAMAARDYPVDADRIYLVGDKAGGAGVYALMSHMPGQFAAAIVSAGQWTPEFLPVPTGHLRIYHGADDSPFTAAMATMLAGAAAQAGADVSLEIKPQTGQDIGRTLYEDSALWAWLFRHKRGR